MSLKYLFLTILITTFIFSYADDVYVAPDPEPTSEEVYSLELLNRFRMNPNAEAEIIAPGGKRGPGISSWIKVDFKMFYDELMALKPVHPLVMNLALLKAARRHSHYQIKNGQGHVETPGKAGFVAKGFSQRCKLAGYTGGPGGENCFNSSKSAYFGHIGFIIDWGKGGPGGMQPGRGHRANMMKAKFNEVGISALPYSGKFSITHNLGRGKSARYAGGVIYRDKNKNGFYDVGEGVGNVKIKSHDGKSETFSWKSGGYALGLNSTGKLKLIASLNGVSYEKEFDAGSHTVKFDWSIPQEQDLIKIKELLKNISGIKNSPSNKKRIFQAAVKLYLIGKTLGMGPKEKSEFNKYVKDVKNKIDDDQKEIRSLWSKNEKKEFKIKVSKLKKEYVGTLLSNWISDASYTYNVKKVVSDFEKKVELTPKKMNSVVKRKFLKSIQASRRKVKTPEYLKIMDGFANRIQALVKSKRR
ncbi:MAG: hypothetical protein COA79_16460 [Planctomycetota bacterium]|nr:MAG: hypothetical protein COA79_16460 [Planctomycetota bacterium]